MTCLPRRAATDRRACLSLADPTVRALAAEMQERERGPRVRMLEYQRGRLHAIVRHAVTSSPYYREVIGNKAIGRFELQQLPILTKKTLMEEFDRIVTDRRLRRTELERHLASAHPGEPMFDEYRVVASGGTSRERSIAVYDRAAWKASIANVVRQIAVQGVTSQTRVLGIGAPTPLHLTNRLFAEIHAGRTDVPRLDVTTKLADIVEALNAYQPDMLVTYPSLIRRLADEQRMGRLSIAPRMFGSTADTLTGDVRALADTVWGAPVLNIYGATETGLIGTECPWTNGIHVAEDMLVLEAVDERNQPVPAGTPGHKLLVTTLFNRTLPLIRYELADLVTLAEGPCPCGRPHLRLTSIDGRREDVLDLPGRNGGRVSVHALQLRAPLLRMPDVMQFQVRQEPTGLRVRLVLRETVSAAEITWLARQAIAAELERAGAAVETLVIEEAERIERAGSGAKERLVVRAG